MPDGTANTVMGAQSTDRTVAQPDGRHLAEDVKQLQRPRIEEHQTVRSPHAAARLAKADAGKVLNLAAVPGCGNDPQDNGAPDQPSRPARQTFQHLPATDRVRVGTWRQRVPGSAAGPAAPHHKYPPTNETTTTPPARRSMEHAPRASPNWRGSCRARS